MVLKTNLLNFYRDSIQDTIIQAMALKKNSDKSNLINRKMKELLETKLQEAENRNLDEIFMIHYTYYIVMLESRNKVWPYDVMSFSRRIGELWEPFCKLPFDYPSKDIVSYIPPTYTMFRDNLNAELITYINSLDITDEQRQELGERIRKIFELSESGAINLKEDLHFEADGTKYVVDYKSGFSSNEKGNVNRLLLVAKIYSIMNGYKCMMFVRQPEEENNHYLKTLKNSKLWEVYCSTDTYNKIFELTGVNLREWMDKNMNWKIDISSEFRDYLENNNLIQYLTW